MSNFGDYYHKTIDCLCNYCGEVGMLRFLGEVVGEIAISCFLVWFVGLMLWQIPAVRLSVMAILSVLSICSLMMIYTCRFLRWNINGFVSLIYWGRNKVSSGVYRKRERAEMERQEQENERLRQEAQRIYDEKQKREAEAWKKREKARRESTYKNSQSYSSRTSESRQQDYSRFKSTNSSRGQSSSNSTESMNSKILGIDGAFARESLKKAYWTKMKQYHPDKVSALGKEFREMAGKKASEINEAYSYFKQRYGWS